MFCQKCGNKVDENTVFCPRCGARQPVGVKMEHGIESTNESAEQKAEKPPLPTHNRKTLRKVYEQLQEKAALCPEIESVVLKDSGSEVVVTGKYSKYRVLISGNLINLGLTMGIQLTIYTVLPLVAYNLCLLFLFSDTFVFWGVWGLAILLNLYGYHIAAVGQRERETVMSFIKTVLNQPKYIEPSGHPEKFFCRMSVFVGILYLAVKLFFLICN